jgi:hypothetical protein
MLYGPSAFFDTPAFNRTLQNECDAIDVFARHFPDLSFIKTGKKDPSIADGFVAKGESLLCVVETKCREFSFEKLTTPSSMGGFDSEWMIDFNKIARVREISTALCLPFYVWNFFVPDKTLVIQKVCEKSGVFACDFRIQTKTVKATISSNRMKTDTLAFVRLSNQTILV